jgi:hypothetical protein
MISTIALSPSVMGDGFTVIQKPWANVPQGSSRARLTIALASHDPACLADRLRREFGGSESDEEPPGVAAADQRAAECSRVRCDFIHPGTTGFFGEGFAGLEVIFSPPTGCRSAFHSDRNHEERGGLVFSDQVQRDDLLMRMRIIPGPVE